MWIGFGVCEVSMSGEQLSLCCIHEGKTEKLELGTNTKEKEYKKKKVVSIINHYKKF